MGRIFSRVTAAEVLYNRLLPRFEPGGLNHVGGMLQLSWRVGATLEVFSTRKILRRLGRWGVLLAGGADRRCHSVTVSQSHAELGGELVLSTQAFLPTVLCAKQDLNPSAVYDNTKYLADIQHEKPRLCPWSSRALTVDKLVAHSSKSMSGHSIDFQMIALG